MIYSETHIGHKNILEDMELLYQDENNKLISDLCIKESKRLNKNLINLEEICDFIIKNNINFDYLINELAYINGIDVNSIAFSVYPITLYENELIYDLVLNLQEEGRDIFISSDPRNDISYAFDIIIKECIDTDSIDPLDYIDQVCFNENEEVNEFLGRSLAHMKGGLKHFAADQVDRHGFGKIFDSTRTVKGINKKTGAIEDQKETIKNGRVKNVFGHGMVGDFVSDVVVDGIRSGGSEYIVNRSKALIDKALAYGKKAPEQTINKIDSAVNNLNHQSQANPQKRSLFRMLIDKLISIKNKILAWLRGHRN